MNRTGNSQDVGFPNRDRPDDVLRVPLRLLGRRSNGVPGRPYLSQRASTEHYLASLQTAVCNLASAGGSVDTAVVGMRGFEPRTPRSQGECASKLRHIPCVPMRLCQASYP